MSNSLKGFFGYGAGFSGSTGEAACFSNEQLYGGPCVNIDKEVDESDHVGRFNLTYQLDDNKLIYFTWSEGFRPGGINRKGTLPPYTSDFLTNYELGWKTTWADNRLSFNGAVFQENWDKGNGFRFMFGTFCDIATNAEANEAAAAFIRSKIAEVVKDPETARKLTPDDLYAKRPLCNEGYYETYNRDNVSLVSIREHPIAVITPAGVRTADGDRPPVWLASWIAAAVSPGWSASWRTNPYLTTAPPCVWSWAVVCCWPS